MSKFDEHQKRINKMIGKRIAKGERQVAKIYASILSEIRSMLASLFEKYEKGGQLTWEEVAKYDRFNKFMQEVSFLLKQKYGEIAKAIFQIIGELYDETYNLFAYGVEREARARLNYSTSSPAQLLAAATNPATKLTPKVWSDRDRSTLVYDIQQTLTQGFAAGSTYSTMAKALKSMVEGSAYRSVRVVRTEGHRVSESAKHDAAYHADKQGVRMIKRWNSLDDLAVRRTPVANHEELDGAQIQVIENFKNRGSIGPSPGAMSGPNSAAQNINCRCFLTYQVSSIQKKQHDGLEKLTFEEWKKTRLKQ